MLYLGKKHQTKAVPVGHYFYSYIISPVKAISSEGVGSGTEGYKFSVQQRESIGKAELSHTDLLLGLTSFRQEPD